MSDDEESRRGMKRELEEDNDGFDGGDRERQRRRLDDDISRPVSGGSTSPNAHESSADMDGGKETRTPPQEESPVPKHDDAESAATGGDVISDKAPSESAAAAAGQQKQSSTRGEWRKSVERMVISDADASFILGTGGRTKKKLARVSKTDLSVSRNDASNETILEIRGTPESIERAKTYIGFVMQQRVGPVHLEDDVKARDDIVILDIPHGCVGYVTGHKGQGLRSVEEEFATLMFFTDVNRNKSPPTEEEAQTKVEKLVVFSPSERSRQGAVLKVMSAIEQKMPGHFTKDVKPVVNSEDAFGTDIVVVSSEDYSYALGKGGGTRKKLARASGAILEYIGEYAYIAGTLKQRERARKYLEWLCAQRVNTMDLTGIEERDDVVWIDVPMDCVAYLTGHKGQALRRMEEQTGTFIFLDSTSDKSAPTEKLFIFGETSSGRQRARTLALQRVNDKQTGASQRRYEYRDPERRVDRADRDRYDNRDRYDRDRVDRERFERRDRRPYGAYRASPSPPSHSYYGRRYSPPRHHRPQPSYPRATYEDYPPRRPADHHYEERRYSPPRQDERLYNHSPPRGGGRIVDRGHSPPIERSVGPGSGAYHEPPSQGGRYDDRRHHYRY